MKRKKKLSAVFRIFNKKNSLYDKKSQYAQNQLNMLTSTMQFKPQKLSLKL